MGEGNYSFDLIFTLSLSNLGEDNRHDAVAEVHVTRNISGLETLVTKQNSLVPKLEHAINVVN